ncbi:MAG TPA: aldo/keto reductase [Polyangia bacterium]|jgi:diketogulonate reductase-like aldo/keto reductase|nr:aldo/keto reductase [Polyangia bacterium]
MATSKNEPIRRPFGTMPDLVPVIGQGTWLLGDARGRGGEVAALRAGIAAGATHIDTAEYYGAAEDMVGEAIKGLRREELFIVSKVMPSNGSFKGTIRACEATLRKLGTSYLDVYLLHWRGGIPLEETMSALEALVDQGKIRALGVSNFNVSDLEEAESALTSGRIVCNQVLYHLEERHIDGGLVDYCAKQNIAVVGYSPFGHGQFPRAGSAEGKALAAVAARHGATPRQVALAFLTRKAPLFTIPKSSSVAHTNENVGALSLHLSPEDIAAIDAAFPVNAGPDDELPML